MVPQQQSASLFLACMDAVRQKSFETAYNRTFDLVRADTPEQKRKAFSLRHQVYCQEHDFERPNPTTPYLEMDEFDERAVHYLLIRQMSEETAGTLRVILPNDDRPEKSFPLQKLCAHPLLNAGDRVLSLCEISRFCTATRFRRRDNDGALLSSYHDQDTERGHTDGGVVFVRRKIPYAPAALLRGAFETALRARIMECLWMVELPHLWSLDRIGFPYRMLGPRVNVHGGLQPLIFNIKHVLDSMRRKAPHCWEIVSDNGRLQETADELGRNDWHDRLLEEISW